MEITHALNVVRLDVRPILETGVDPFSVIMNSVKEIRPNEELLIINTFEPLPLIAMLKTRGYTCTVTRPTHGEVHTLITPPQVQTEEFTQKKQAPENLDHFEQAIRHFAHNMQQIDVRNLEMPEPMVKILEKLETLPDTHALFIDHKRIPQFLLPELEKRNYTHLTKTVSDDEVKMLIFKRT